MNYDYIIAEVAGNKIVLVTSRVKKDRYPEAAKEILDAVKGAEGVAFLKLPLRGGDYRIETPADEFCGNAILAAAFYYGREHGVNSVRMEAPGCDDFITVQLEGNEAIASIPLPYYREKSEFSGTEAVDMVFDGIAETVVNTEEDYPLGKIRFFLISRISRYHVPAAGLVLVNQNENKLKSALYIEKADEVFAENSSASAVAAWAYALNGDKSPAEPGLTVAPQQPGGVISASLVWEENEITAITVKAAIEMK